MTKNFLLLILVMNTAVRAAETSYADIVEYLGSELLQEPSQGIFAEYEQKSKGRGEKYTFIAFCSRDSGHLEIGFSLSSDLNWHQIYIVDGEMVKKATFIGSKVPPISVEKMDPDNEIVNLISVILGVKSDISGGRWKKEESEGKSAQFTFDNGNSIDIKISDGNPVFSIQRTNDEIIISKISGISGPPRFCFKNKKP
jgi:hypothetical protein